MRGGGVIQRFLKARPTDYRLEGLKGQSLKSSSGWPGPGHVALAYHMVDGATYGIGSFLVDLVSLSCPGVSVAGVICPWKASFRGERAYL